jgi:predicted nucleic acid-binding protein
MALPRRLYVDANIFIRLLEGNDQLAAALGGLFARAWGQGIALVTSELTLAEVLVVPIREGTERGIKRYDDLIRSNNSLEVSAVDRIVLRSAAALRASYRTLKLPDAIHLATALRADCSQFLTGDLKLSGSYGEAARSTQVVRPEIAYLDGLAVGGGA